MARQDSDFYANADVNEVRTEHATYNLPADIGITHITEGEDQSSSPHTIKWKPGKWQDEPIAIEGPGEMFIHPDDPEIFFNGILTAGLELHLKQNEDNIYHEEKAQGSFAWLADLYRACFGRDPKPDECEQIDIMAEIRRSSK